MSNRHLARTLTLQALYEWDFRGRNIDPQTTLSHVISEFAPEYDDQGFTQSLMAGIVEKQEELDELITRFAPDWPLDKITVVDRNVLRLGIYELKYGGLPHKVAINEAIELAKAYGGPSSGRFINGVLGSVFKELVSLGLVPESSLEAELPVTQISAGGVVIRKSNDGYQVVLIKDGIGRWTFPKGKAEGEGSLEEIAVRETALETGLTDLKTHGEIGTIQVVVNEPGKLPTKKQVHYYLMSTQQIEISIKVGPGLQGGGWFPLATADQVVSYENARAILRDARDRANQLSL